MTDVELLAPAAGIRQVGTRCLLPLVANSGLTDGMSTTAHYVRDKVSGSLKIIYPNWRMNGASEGNIGAGDFKLALKLPDNTIKLSDQNAGGGAITAPAGNVEFTFALNNPLPADSLIMPRMYQHCAAGIYWSQLSGGVDSAYGSAPADGMDIGTTANDKTMSGTISFGNGIGFFPVVIAANTRQSSIIAIGTSREVGDYISDASLDVGLVAEAVGKVFGYTNAAISGTLLSNWNAGSHTFLNQLIAAGYWSHVSNEYCVNDAVASSAAVMAAARAAFATALKAAKSDIILIGQTLYPFVGTSDIGVTKSGQTIGANQQRIMALNELIRAGIVGEDFVWDAADGIDPFREGKYPVSWNPNDASRTPCLFTGSIVGDTLTVTAISQGSLNRGDPVIDPAAPVSGGVLISTWIIDQLTGTAGSTGTYKLNRAYSGSGTYPKPNVSSRALSTAAMITADGLHATRFGRQMIIRNQGAALLNLLRRPRLQ